MMDEAGNRQRFKQVYQENYSRILGYVLRRTSSPEDAADVVAETFFIAWRRLDDVPQGPESRLWLYGVARRTLANYRRGERRRLRLAGRLEQDLPRLVEVSVPPASDEIEDVRRALVELGEKDREILGLAIWEGLTATELATVLDCSPNAAKIRLHRARRKLAVRLFQAGIAVKPRGATGHGAERRVVHTRAVMEEQR